MKTLTPNQEAILALQTALDEIERLHKYVPSDTPVHVLNIPQMIRSAITRLTTPSYFVVRIHHDGQKVYLSPSNFWVTSPDHAHLHSLPEAERHAKRLRATVEQSLK